MTEYILKGLDGGNPLAYLAALGTLRTTTLMWPEQRVYMRWSQIEGSWRPTLSIKSYVGTDLWLSALDTFLRGNDEQPAFVFSKDLNVSCAVFRGIALVAQENITEDDRSYADFVTAFGNECLESVANGKKTGIIADTAFRTMSGAGHQHFLGFMRELCKQTVESHLRASLLESWKYTDSGPGMRWDPADDRRYAQRWNEPSGDPLKTMRGANRLAIEALPLLPTAPVKGKLETTGFRQQRGLGVIWTWPIWTSDLSLDVVRSLLSLAELQSAVPNRNTLNAMGIEEVYRCQRVTQGKYRNFSNAVPA